MFHSSMDSDDEESLCVVGYELGHIFLPCPPQQSNLTLTEKKHRLSVHN